ncbi:MAG: radical SAM protein [Muribaculaceae bacterium]|nr:radical SAM protein [Muribaculaceae bacterium]
MDIYKIIKLVGINKVPGFVKLLGLWSLIKLKRRFLGVFIDPVAACNLRCKMCYFSNPQKRSQLKGTISEDKLTTLENKILPYALKMQIGCGTEPTLYPNLALLIKKSKNKGVPYISITTNGQLIAQNKISLDALIEAGLDEITISVHGTTKEIYEELMPGAKFELLTELIHKLGIIKSNTGKPLIRVNFTINSLNIENLRGNCFFSPWDDGNCKIDIIQLRPVQKIGESEWKDFDLSFLEKNYNETVGNVIERAKQRDITCLAPTIDSLKNNFDIQDDVSALLEDISYCYISPDTIYKNDFLPSKENIFSYLKKKKMSSLIFKTIFGKGKVRGKNTSKKLQYKVS